MKQVLLVRPDKAGDAVKTLPALRLATKKFPQTAFSILCSKENSSVFSYERGIRIFTLPAHWQNLKEEELKSFIEKLPIHEPFDLAVSLLADAFPEVEALLKLTPALTHWSALQNPGKTEEKNIAYILGSALGEDLEQELESVDRSPVLSEFDREEARQALGTKTGTRIAFCPFAGTEQRSHSDFRWKRFVQYAAKKSQNVEILLLGSRYDRKRLEYLKGQNPSIKIHCPTSFRALGAYLEEVDAVVAVDSGPLHLAQALGKPTLGILSGGDYRRWFSRLTPHDQLLPRGIFSRHPGLLQMCLAFKKWKYA